jgi:prophage tail gpP-like protein
MAFTSDVISQPAEPGTDPDEIAEILVANSIYTLGGAGATNPASGGAYSDWETVWLQHRWMAGWPMFRFTTAERDPPGDDIEARQAELALWTTFRIRPPDHVVIKLGGQVAITGVVIVRQTAYDGNSHAVSIQGNGTQWFTWRGAIVDEKQTFYGSYVDIATQVMKPFEVVPRVVGTINPKPWEPDGAHSQTGETVWDFLNRLAPERKVRLGADYMGNLLLIGDHVSQVVDELIEGENIKSCQCTIKIDDWYSEYGARGQKQNTNDGPPKEAAQQDKWVKSEFYRRYSPLLVAMEHPVWTDDEVAMRAEHEARTGEGQIIEATVVVYGWFTSRHVLWAQLCGEKVILNSPMTTLVGFEMAIRAVTCTQDKQSGSQTTLDLCAPWLLNDSGLRAGGTGAGGEILPAPGSAQGNPNVPATTGSQFSGGAGGGAAGGVQGLPGSPSGPAAQR